MAVCVQELKVQKYNANVPVVGSATLWWLAKKRQWDVRQSIRRASRRITGRSMVDVSKQNRQGRRASIRLASPPPGKNARPKQGHDLEKGLPMSTKEGRTITTISSTIR